MALTMSGALTSEKRKLIAERDKLLDVEPNEFTSELELRSAEINERLAAIEVHLIEARDAEARDVAGRQLAAVSHARGESSVDSQGRRRNDAESMSRRTAGGVPLQVQDRPLPEVYHRDGEHSFFQDVYLSRTRQDAAATGRLEANQAAQSRAISTIAGGGGQFAPPLWISNEFVEYARPSRVVADLMLGHELPWGIASVNLPKVLTGTAAGVTVTENTAITNVDMTTGSVTGEIATMSGLQVLSIELLRQSGTAIDQVVLGDLAGAVAGTLETQVISGSGANGQLLGIDKVGGSTSVAFTTASPSLTSTTPANSLHFAIVKAATAIATKRHQAATAIVMHPRRWAWITTMLDTTNRPIITGEGAFNSPGIVGAPAAAGYVGHLAGLPVYVSGRIPTNLGAGTNQDEILVIKADDLHLWESPLELQAFEAALASQNSIQLRALEFAASIPNRYAESISVITGTGLVDPGI